MFHSSSFTTGGNCCISPIIRSWTPPKGALLRLNLRSTSSTLSSRSARTILISSITSRSRLLMIFLFSRLNRIPCDFSFADPPGTHGPKGIWKKEWIVTPPAFMAATPVGATTIILLGERFFNSRKKVVFPVPALPVRNRFSPVNCTKSLASCN